MLMDLELHPLCTLFPRMTDAEFSALKADIKTNGLRQPIVVHDGKILDGGNRYRACIEVGEEPATVEFDFSGDDIVSYVLSCNLHRRHLTPGQQAAIVAAATDWLEAETRGGNGSNQHGSKEQSGNVAALQTVADRAAQSGASERTQRMADKVARSNPELAKKVAHGEISLPKAVEQVSGSSRAANAKDASRRLNDGEESSSTPEYVGPSESEIEAALDQERADREKYDALVEVAYADDKLGAALKLVDAQATQIGQLRAEIAVLRERQTGLMNEKVQLESQAKRWMRIAKEHGWTPGAAK